MQVSARLVWLSSSGITNSYNHTQAEDALRSAAYTYVVAALGSLATLILLHYDFYGQKRLRDRLIVLRLHLFKDYGGSSFAIDVFFQIYVSIARKFAVNLHQLKL